MAGEPSAARDSALMRRALANAERGWGQTAPNPMVGAVVVSKSGEVVADGWHHRFGEAHAEVEALRAAGDRVRGSTIYVTLEPCTHQGKTPPCVDALIAAGVKRVVIAARDPNPVAGGGVERLRKAGVDVAVGIESAAALELNAAYYNSFAFDRPWVTLKFAMSADGAIADPTGARRWISGPESRREGHRMRANADAVAVGIGTVLADDPELTVRDSDPPRIQPTRVIFDSRLRTPLDAAVVRGATAVPTVIIASGAEPSRAATLEERGIRVFLTKDLEHALRLLRSVGVKSLLVEGGAKLAWEFLRNDLVDRVALFEAPLVLGEAALRAFAHSPAEFPAALRRQPVVRRSPFGEDTLTVYAMRSVPTPGNDRWEGRHDGEVSA